MPEERYLPFLASVLTPRRLDHSLGVMQVMGELAQVYGLDQGKAHTIGILHDAGKDLSLVQQERLIAEGRIHITHECERDYVIYLHAPVGAYFVQKELAIQDEIILAAIATHSYFGTSPHFNDPLCWCMRFSDILEPTRDWSSEPLLMEGSERLKDLAYTGRMAEGALFITGVLISWYEQKGIPIHPNLRQIKTGLTAI
jgi:predicted HD superfamily hydrolase involved in NAD metabolism